jgi:hypothetical protein
MAASPKSDTTSASIPAYDGTAETVDPMNDDAGVAGVEQAPEQTIPPEIVRGVLAVLGLYHAYHSPTLRATLEAEIEKLGLGLEETLDALSSTPRPGS